MSKKLLHEDNNLVSVSLGKWANWTECTKTCDEGIRMRKKLWKGIQVGKMQGTCNNFKCDGKCSHYFIYSRLAYLKPWNVT